MCHVQVFPEPEVPKLKLGFLPIDGSHPDNARITVSSRGGTPGTLQQSPYDMRAQTDRGWRLGTPGRDGYASHR